MRIPGEVGRIEADQLEQFGDPRASLQVGTDFVNDERLLDDVAGAHPRIERRVRILEDHLHVAARSPHPLGRVGQDVLAAEPHLA